MNSAPCPKKGRDSLRLWMALAGSVADLDVLSAGGLGRLVEHVQELVALDVEVGQQSVEPAGQPPCSLVEDGHEGGDEGQPDDEGVNEDAGGKGEADLLDHNVVAEDEAGEDRDHDDRGGDDDAAGLIEAMHGALSGSLTVDVCLAHGGH